MSRVTGEAPVSGFFALKTEREQKLFLSLATSTCVLSPPGLIDILGKHGGFFLCS